MGVQIMNITMTQEQYESLATMASAGAKTADGTLAIHEFLRKIESDNGITRFFVNIRWQDARPSKFPVGEFPHSWPPELSGSITRFDRAVAKSDVMDYVNSAGNAPVGVLVTTDPAGIYGWTKLEDFFAQ